MGKILTPDGTIYDLEDCVILDGEQEDQEVLEKELFETTGILVGTEEGGKDNG